MKFKLLTLENFQAHKNTTITFSSGLNVIVGPSDTGKSSILRALRKLIRDNPAGKDFINKDATSVKLSLTIVNDEDQEYTIIRQITPSKNLYYLDDQEFGGFGREIPKEIQDVLEMSLIELENSEEIDLHFSDQHDGPFMISKGLAGTRSKLLGRIAGLHILDRGIVDVNRDVRAGTSAFKITSIEKDRLQMEVDKSPDTTGGHLLYDTCKKQLQTLEMELITLDKLRNLKEDLNIVVEEGKKQRLHFNSLPNIDVDFQGIHTSLYTLGRLQELHQKLNSINTQIEDIASKDYDDIIHSAQQEWVTLLKELKICPTCKQPTLEITL